MAAPIESPRNRRLANVRRLRRQPDHFVVVEGPRAVAEAVRAGAVFEQVFVTTEARTRHTDVLDGIPVEIEEVSERAMRGIAATETPQGLVALVANPARPLDELMAAKRARVLVLTDVRDPGNVGTALRAAEAAGFDAAVVCQGSCDPANDKALRASAGAVFHLPHAAHVDPVLVLDALADWRRLGASVDGDITLADVDTQPPLAVVVGNEARGFSDDVRARIDQTVRIPMHGRVASLNAGVAAALLMYALGSP